MPIFINRSVAKRSIVVEWLVRHGYGIEGPWKVATLYPGFAIRRLENFVNRAVNGYLLQIREG